MLPVSTILDHLGQQVAWADGESIASLRGRLTQDQLDGPGQVRLRISWRSDLPGMIRVRILQEDVQIGVLQERMAPDLSWQTIAEMVSEWERLGWLQNIQYNT